MVRKKSLTEHWAIYCDASSKRTLPPRMNFFLASNSPTTRPNIIPPGIHPFRLTRDEPLTYRSISSLFRPWARILTRPSRTPPTSRTSTDKYTRGSRLTTPKSKHRLMNTAASPSRLHPERYAAEKAHKLHPRAASPFRVRRKINPNTYDIAIPRDWGIPTTFNIYDLVPYQGRLEVPIEPGLPPDSTESSLLEPEGMMGATLPRKE